MEVSRPRKGVEEGEAKQRAGHERVTVTNATLINSLGELIINNALGDGHYYPILQTRKLSLKESR